ncbi:hypothetical protein ACI65C_004112 [Semiaphis heraclei]
MVKKFLNDSTLYSIIHKFGTINIYDLLYQPRGLSICSSGLLWINTFLKFVSETSHFYLFLLLATNIINKL